jgi:RNA polymerase sigma-70 factor (ECF subfamily)
VDGDQTTRLNLWIARLGKGDDSALEEVLVFFDDRLVRLARRMLKGYPEVRRMEQTDDVLQNATLRLCRALRARAGELAVEGSRGTLHTRDFFRLAALQIRRELLDLAKHYRSRAILPHPRGDGPGGEEDGD